LRRSERNPTRSSEREGEFTEVIDRAKNLYEKHSWGGVRETKPTRIGILSQIHRKKE